MRWSVIRFTNPWTNYSTYRLVHVHVELIQCYIMYTFSSPLPFIVSLSLSLSLSIVHMSLLSLSQSQSGGAGKLYLATGEASDQLRSGLCPSTTSVVNSKVCKIYPFISFLLYLILFLSFFP